VIPPRNAKESTPLIQSTQLPCCGPPAPAQLDTLDTIRKAIIPRLIPQRAITIRIPRIRTPPGARDILLGPILGAAAARGDAKITRQVAGLEDNPRAAALRLALVT
jgi:hypothetical protein